MQDRIEELEGTIDALQRALNTERKRSAALRNENLTLKAKLATHQDIAFIAGGMGPRVFELLQEKNQEIASANADVERLTNAIRWACRVSEEKADAVKHLLQEQAEQLNNAANAQPLRQVPLLLMRAAFAMDDVAVEDYNRAAQGQGGQIDVYNEPVRALWAALTRTRLNGVRSYVGSVLLDTTGLSNDPRVVADEILRECEELDNHEPQMETLERLTMDWIQKHLSSPSSPAPANHRTLREGLIQAYRFRNSGMTQAEYAGDISNDIGERTLRRFVRWYEVIEQYRAIGNTE